MPLHEKKKASAAQPAGAWVFGLLPVGVAVQVFLIGSGVIETERSAPGWVFFLGGLVFLAGGLLVVVHGSGRQKGFLADLVYNSAGWTIVLSMMAIGNWVAFGPGERQGESSISLPIESLWQSTGDLKTRVGFGIVVVILDLIVLWAIVHALRRLAQRRQTRS